MKVRKIFVQTLNFLFPSVIAYINFIAMLCYLWVTVCFVYQGEKLLSIISGVASLYCFNEWSKEVEL